jgi:hypothetical protein
VIAPFPDHLEPVAAADFLLAVRNLASGVRNRRDGQWQCTPRIDSELGHFDLHGAA